MSALSIRWLEDRVDEFPPVEQALGSRSEAPGLLAAGGDLTPDRLRRAYEHGIFPWYSLGQPILWWSPDPRMTLRTSEFKLSRSLRRTLLRFIASPNCSIRVDSAFREVITACARTPRPGQDGTWIVPEMVNAYCAWHQLGEVHSFETWIDGQLAGGLYGVSVGRMFFGESMFSRSTDASKIALAALVAFCREHGIELIDCQQRTAHLASLGAREISRREFTLHLHTATQRPPVPEWSYHPSMWRQLNLSPQPTPSLDPSPER